MNDELYILELKQRAPGSRRQNNSKIYFFIEGENVLENLLNRHSRPHQLYKTLFPRIKAALKLTGDIDAYWSQKAGCSCGCSPGFIVKNGWNIGLGVTNIYVTISNTLQTSLKLEFPKAA
jgi:hypothetical protein